MHIEEPQSRKEKGQSIIIVTLMIVALLGISGVTIDAGRLYMTRQQLQGYTDAATLAGSRLLPYGNEEMSVQKTKIDQAVQRALQTYARNVNFDVASVPVPPYSYTPGWNPGNPDQANLKYSIDMTHQAGGEQVVDHVAITVLYSDDITAARDIPKERAMLVEADRDVDLIFGSMLGPPVAKASRPAAGFKSVFEVKWKFNTLADVHSTPAYAVDSVEGKEVVLTASKSGYIWSLDAWGEENTGRTWAYWKYQVLENGGGARTLCYPYTSKYFCEPPPGNDVELNYAIIGSPRVTRQLQAPEQCRIDNSCIDVTSSHYYDNDDGTTTLIYEVCNACTNALSNVAFSLPGQPALWPSNGGTYQAVKSYNCENPTSNPFYSIKYETIGEGIKQGQCDTFMFTLPTAVAQYQVQVLAKYSTYTQGGTFASDCSFREPVDLGRDVVLFTSYPKSDDTVTKRGYLYALDLYTGDKMWSSYVGQRRYQLGAYSGGARGTTAGVSYLDSTPAFSPDGTIVYYASRDGRLYAYKVGDGSAAWPNVDCAPTDPLINSCITLAAGTISTPAVDPRTGVIYVGTSRQRDGSGSGSPKSDRGVLYAIRPNGQILWTWYPSRTGYGFDSSPTLWPANNPTALYIGNRDNYLYKVNPTTGALIWEYLVPSSISPDDQPSGNPRSAISATPLVVEENGNRYIYFATEYGAGFKVRDNGSNVSIIWNTWLGYDVSTTASPPGGGTGDNVRRIVHMSPAIANEFVYFGVVTIWDHKCAYQAVRKEDGMIFQSFIMENDTHANLRVAPNNWLYYGSCDNYTYGVDTNPDSLDSRLIR